MITRRIGPLAVRVVYRCQFDAVQGNIRGQMSLIEDLSGTHTPHTEWFVAHCFFLFDEIVLRLLSILFSGFWIISHSSVAQENPPRPPKGIIKPQNYGVS